MPSLDEWLADHAKRQAQQEEDRCRRIRSRKEARQALNTLIALTAGANCYRADLFATLSDFIDRAP